MMPLPICKHPHRITPELAQEVAEVCNNAYRTVFKRDNKLPKHPDCPVLCVNALGGYWCLECNDPNISSNELGHVLKILRAKVPTLRPASNNEPQEGKYLLRNYNRFLLGSVEQYHWEDFYIHRFPHDFKKLVLFDSVESAEQFLEAHPDVEEEFDAWVLPADESAWNGSRV